MAKLNDARYHRRLFPPGPWVRTRPFLRHGRVPNIGGPAHPTKFW